MLKGNYYMPRLSEQDKSEVKQMLSKAPNLESFIEDFRMRYGFRPYLIPQDKIPADPEDRERVANNVISLNQLAQ